jgi:hypothetical protein
LHFKSTKFLTFFIQNGTRRLFTSTRKIYYQKSIPLCIVQCGSEETTG